MIERLFWKQRVTLALKRRPIVWLAGVRRVGKTTLCKQLKSVVYMDCELPSVRRQLEDIEYFWGQHSGKTVVLDEIHRLTDPSAVLKIAHDHFPSVKVIATGSSTLAAKRKFKDTLTDRKHDVWIQPLLLSELRPTQSFQLDKRLLRGGLPPAYFSENLDEYFYREWIDSFWAKDIQELFSIDRKSSFIKLAELLLRQSGELMQVSSLATPCEISRQTVQNYIECLETTLFVHLLRPWGRGKQNEIVRRPKIYGFDTGMVCFAKGIFELRPEDKGLLLEHTILQELLSQFGRDEIWFWRDKQKHEIDFLVTLKRSHDVHAIECKWTREAFNTSALTIFRKLTPDGLNILTATNIEKQAKRRIGSLEILECPPWQVAEVLVSLHHH
ncbi:MAG: ATP-binding protein [Deltaproteobacteria bacterium]|nr:ATP-binding protein [Deltaproteobacteria bacterium]